MTQKLLFAVDFSPYTEKILGCAGELAGVGITEVILLYVIRSRKHVDYGDETKPAYVEELKEAEAHLSRLASDLEQQGLTVTKLVESGHPAERIVEVAKDEDADLIFMGAHGKGLIDRATIGSVSERVLKKSDRPVLIQHCRVLKGGDGYTCENVCSSLFGNVLVADDFSEYSELVKPLLLNFSQTVCAPVTLLYVQEEKDSQGRGAEESESWGEAPEREKLKGLKNELDDLCESVTIEVVEGTPHTAILEYADKVNASLIILGAFGQRGIVEGLLGRVTEKVVRGSDRPVLVLKSR